MPRIPAAFQNRRVIRNLNVAAVGLALACVTGAVLGQITGSSGSYSAASFAIAIPTLCIGAFWAAFFRPTVKLELTGFRVGWWGSVVLAIINAQLACFLVVTWERWEHAVDQFGMALVYAPTIGIIFWLPALLLTFFCFGFPIIRAQTLAEKGLAGEERGEIIVGATSVVMATFGLLVTYLVSRSVYEFLPIRIIGYFGILAGAAAAYLSCVRELRRRAFVRSVEAGQIAGFRVDPSGEGKVLVRITSQGEGYRVSDFREELFELDAQGEAKQSRYCELP